MRKLVFGVRIRLGNRWFRFKTDKGLGYIFALVIIMTAIWMVMTNAFSIRDRLLGRNVWNYPLTVAHAGGIIGGYTYTNSMDAVRLNYERGHRTFELDFSVTSDNVMVGKHDWDHVVQEGVVSGYVPTAEEFTDKLIYEKYSTLTFAQVCQLLEEYQDMWLITDTKNLDAENVKRDMTLIVQTARELNLEHVLDRIVVQIYTPEMYKVAKDVYSFDNWIFTLYQYWDCDIEKFPDIVRFCDESGIETITVKWSHYSKELVEMTAKYGINLYVHTVNDLDEAKQYLEDGVCGIYTDSIKPEELGRKEE